MKGDKMKTFKTLLFAAILMVLTTINAHAIGKTEKGVLIGIGTMLLLPSMLDNADRLFSSNEQKVVTLVKEPPVEKVIYKTKIIEKVYYEPRERHYFRKTHRHHRKAHRHYHEYERYGYRD